MSIQLRDGLQGQPLDRALEDLLVRFVINSPADDLSTNARVFFLFEEAHWFYLDYVRLISPSLPSLKMKNFSKKLIELFPLIWQGGDPEEGLKEFSSYKQSIPVRGAALFNSQLNKILLVQGMESASWSFPRGKISKDEDDATCAVREVKEEIGFDISPYINDDDYIERTFNGKNYRIYLCKNIPEDFEFRPIARNEINSIKWVDFKALSKKNQSSKYFLVTGMIRPLMDYAKKNRGEINETQVKLEVEAQLKSMLGIGQEPQQVNDPGRELLDFIRESTVKKQIKDQQNMPQHPTMHIPSHMPMYPMPAFGFQPPPFQQFMAPFAPPALPPMGMPPSMQFGLYGINPMMFQGPPLQMRPAQIQPPPSTDQLQRPSLSFRNDEGSKELLSILTKKDEKNNAKGFLSQLMGKESEEPKKKITLLKRSDDDQNDKHKNDLLALIQKQPTKKSVADDDKQAQKEEPPVSQSSFNDNASLDLMNLLRPKKVESVIPELQQPITNGQTKPKMKLLKRESPEVETLKRAGTPKRSETPKIDNEKKNDQKNDKNKSKDERLYEEESSHLTPVPPSKELLSLIKNSKQEVEEDAEIFEDFTDEEFEFDEGEQFEDYEEEEQEQVEQHFAEEEDSPNSYELPAPTEKFGPEPKKKIRLLKRGETLDDLIAEQEKTSKTEEQKNVDDEAAAASEHHEAASVSTIEFSDDDDDEEEEQQQDEEDGNIDNFEDANEFTDDGTPSNGGSAIRLDALESSNGDISYNPPTSGNPLLAELFGQKETTPTPVAESTNSGAEILKLLHRDTPAAVSAPIPTTNTAGNELLGLLHGKSQSPVASQENLAAKNDLLGLLHKAQTPTPKPETPATNAGAEILDILHKKPAAEPVPQASSPSNDLLSLLQKKPAQSPAPQPGTPANDLLSLLHKSPAAATPSPPTSAQPPVESQPEKKDTPSNSLLNLLFQR